ncbi:MAG: hypothetical protein HGA98_03400 [Deltaproteobacteria bacterium]|nr:hypothetical protein [Deltaproteobacteria bacterium]
MADANLAIKITAKDDGSVTLEKVAKSLKSVSVSAKQMEVDVGRSARSLDQALGLVKGSLGALAGTVGVGSVVALGRAFVDAAAQAQSFNTRLRVILGSQAEASRLFGELERYAIKTPFQLAAVVESATTLAGVLQNGAADVQKWLPLIGDLAAMSGLTLQEATGQVVRMYSAGAASADLFRERGILAMLGFQAGVTYSAEETRRKLISAWEDQGSRFRGSTEQMSRDWNGKVSNMADAWDGFKRTVGAALIENPSAVGGIEWTTKKLEDMTSALEKMNRAVLDPEVRAALRGIGLGENAFGRPTDTWDFSYASASNPPKGRRAPSTSAPGSGGAPLPTVASGAAAPGRGPFYSALEGQWGGTNWEAVQGRGDLSARLNAGAALARTAGYSVGYSAQAVVAFWDAQAAAADAVDQAATAASASALEGFAWRQQAEQERAAGGRTVDALAAGVRGGLAAPEGQGGYSAFAVTSYWDDMASAQEKALDADKVQAYGAAIQGLGQVLGGTSSLLLQFYEAGGRESEKLFNVYKGVAMAETTIATAQGIMNVYAGPLGKYPPAAMAMSVAIGALGAAKLGLIAAQQPKGFAFGGIATGPTNALIGEAGAEAVIPLDRLPRLIERMGVTNNTRQVSVVVNAPIESAAMDPATAAALVGVIRREAYGAVRRALTDDPATRRAVRRA